MNTFMNLNFSDLNKTRQNDNVTYLINLESKWNQIDTNIQKYQNIIVQLRMYFYCFIYSQFLCVFLIFGF